jgi:hypothetical protein
MLLATITLSINVIDQDTFKWLIASSGVAYLAANAAKGFADREIH